MRPLSSQSLSPCNDGQDRLDSSHCAGGTLRQPPIPLSQWSPRLMSRDLSRGLQHHQNTLNPHCYLLQMSYSPLQISHLQTDFTFVKCLMFPNPHQSFTHPHYTHQPLLIHSKTIPSSKQ